MKRRWTVVAAIVMMIVVSWIGNPRFVAAQDTFPNHNIEITVPMEPGGILDIATRLVADQLGKELKAPVVVINRPGASGARGTVLVAKAKPDGYTLLAGTLATLIMVHFFQESVPFDTHRDFLPLAYAGESPSLLVVKSSFPAKTLQELINYAKANPGKLSYASAGGLASTSSMNMEFIKSRTGVDIARVIYDGGGPAVTAVLGGHAQMTSAGYPPLRSHIAAGTIWPLATSKKIDELPDVPTFAEVGFPEVLVNWSGFFAPAKTPKTVYDKLVKAFDKALEHPETIEKLKKSGYVPERKTPSEISEMMKSQSNNIAKIVKDQKPGK